MSSGSTLSLFCCFDLWLQTQPTDETGQTDIRDAPTDETGQTDKDGIT
jgi:hypothetical protein